MTILSQSLVSVPFLCSSCAFNVQQIEELLEYRRADAQQGVASRLGQTVSTWAGVLQSALLGGGGIAPPGDTATTTGAESSGNGADGGAAGAGDGGVPQLAQAVAVAKGAAGGVRGAQP